MAANEIAWANNLCYVGQEQALSHECGQDLRIFCENPNCNKPYCSKHASKLDPKYCINCLSDFQVSETTYTKVEEIYSPKSDAIIERKSSCKQIHLSGTSWLFYTNAISSMTEEQLKTVIQWHRACVQFMEHEIDNRKIAENKKLQGIKVTIRKAATTKKIENRAKPKKTLTQEQLMALARAILATGVQVPQDSPLVQMTKEDEG